jgi:putative hydrolase of the HAD superfamily
LTRNFKYALFDLDNTIYPESCGLMEEIGNRMNRFMIERLGFRPEEVSKTRDAFLRSHGTTLNALRRHYAIDPDDFLSFVHDIPLDEYLSYNHSLDQMLERLPIRKIIFTNADAPHARRVLSRLGILRHFESILDIHFLDFVNKPNRRAYLKVLEEISARPEECILIEDSPANIITAANLGMTTVLVREGRQNGAHHHIERITDFERLIGSLPPADSAQTPEEALSENEAESPGLDE